MSSSAGPSAEGDLTIVGTTSPDVVVDAPRGDLATQLQGLTQAALAINSPLSLDEMLQTIVDQACAVVGAHLGACSLTVPGTGRAEGWPQEQISVSLSDKYDAWRAYDAPSRGAATYGLVCAENDVVRMTEAEFTRHPAFANYGQEAERHPRLRGWLAAPLVARDGRNLGLIQLSDKVAGDFTEQDEALLVQLAQLASVAVEKAKLYEETQRHVDQLRGLTDASVAINAARDVREMLEHITRTAVQLIGASGAVTRVTGGPGRAAAVSSYGASRSTLPGLRAPLLDREGEDLGAIELTAKLDGSFTDADEALLVQLAQIASVAIEKAQLAQEVARAEAARFREELLSGISHDMQTPLSTIVGLADLLSRDQHLPEDERSDIYETVSRQARSLRALVQQFLDFSRLESERPLLIRPRPTDVVQVIERVVSLFEHQRELIVGAAHGLPQIEVDPDRLDQILANLVSNAIKYSDGPVRIVARHQAQRLVIDVVDEGDGIPAHERARLFEKFHRGSQSAGTSGTGLGLYITKALVEAQDGTISLHSNEGVGSRFTVSFPVTRG